MVVGNGGIFFGFKRSKVNFFIHILDVCAPTGLTHVHSLESTFGIRLFCLIREILSSCCRPEIGFLIIQTISVFMIYLKVGRHYHPVHINSALRIAGYTYSIPSFVFLSPFGIPIKLIHALEIFIIDKSKESSGKWNFFHG